ncbi:MAG: PA14 domain-containing protein [Bacteroidota bacterium]
MYRILPLFFLLTACAGDPLDITIVNLPAGEEVEDGFTEIPYKVEGPLQADTELLADHEDLSLQLAFRASAGTEATLLLQGRYPVRLPAATVADLPPRLPTNSSPDIWQDLELVFKAPTGNTPAILASAYLNGNLLYFQQELPATDQPAGPLQLSVQAGDLEVADLRYTPTAGSTSMIDAEGKVKLSVPLLRYEFYALAQGTKDVRNWAQLVPKKTGYVNRFDLNYIREAPPYAIRFFGQVDIPKDGQYRWWYFSPAVTRVYVDGNLLLDSATESGKRTDTDSLQLSAGLHDLRVEYIQTGGWNRFDLAYVYEGQESRYLNSMRGTNITTPGAATPLAIETDEDPYLLRSFLNFPPGKMYEESPKRTHVVSVGEAEGPHYSVDLQTGALLQVWRGDFADVHDMWMGRGEPQVMRPLGPARIFDGSPQWATSISDPWPEPPTIQNREENGGYAADEDDFLHRSHQLDADGRPTFHYEFSDRAVTDKIVPAGKGLLRELTNAGASAYTQLAAGTEITELAPGEFALRGPGAKLTIESYDGSGLTIQRGNGMARLLAEVPNNGHVRYRIDW